jgi:AcrR family transcriptional regulator
MSIAERKIREKKQRENMILDAAQQVFFSKGFENSTMDDVATCAELSKGSLYNYFKNKNELCIGIVSRSLELLLEYMENAVADTQASGLELFISATSAFADFKQDHPKNYCALQSYRHHRGGCGSQSKFLGQTSNENARITEIFAEILRKGIKDGSIRQSVAPEDAATVLWGDMDGLLPGYDLTSSKAIDNYRTAVSLLIGGLKK